MRASVVIRSKDEADRLRLTLTSLACQSERPEVVVVNDGSSDHTRSVLAEMHGALDLIAIHHERSVGRSAAANAGAAEASGDIIVFLDGDTLAAPDMVQRHVQEHSRQEGLIVRGETWHLRCTRLFLDPEAGTPKPGEEAKVARMTEAERAKSIVTRAQIRNAFETVDSRAQAGIYPGFGPRRLYELEMEALRTQPDCSVLWAAASGSNQSLARTAFIDSGGFHPELTINEHRELALRLCEQGLRMAGCAGRTYHMIHRSGWRDPLQERDWEDIFYRAHPLPEVELLPLLWESLSDTDMIPASSRIRTLRDLEKAAALCRGLGNRQAVRKAHMHYTSNVNEGVGA
ncbi:MAG TPA: glycosyltransferase family 2 protein [Acidisoma sp.]|uniref:glycosyltransferase family 2 protein n=1 Tax=Acidisoma sp. TaxID=1872115 RepID=UPI002C028609|nr:glycosyltransferase family 2 protein [Acidisoma sp.]HTI01908.1 glycosyltransferase family 2 protein [Acidisoma sp.]